MLEIAERPKVKDVLVKDLNRTIDCFARQTYDVPPELLVIGPNASENFVELAAQAHEVALEAQAADFGCFRILSQKDGDKRVVWCRKVIAEIKAAKKMFMDLISKGMTPYKVGVNGAATSVVMDEFDPLAEEVIFMPMKAIRGG